MIGTAGSSGVPNTAELTHSPCRTAGSERATKNAVEEIENNLTWDQRLADKVADLNGDKLILPGSRVVELGGGTCQSASKSVHSRAALEIATAGSLGHDANHSGEITLGIDGSMTCSLQLAMRKQRLAVASA